MVATADSARAATGSASPESERVELMALADDLARAWYHPGATAETRKRMLRTMLEEVIVRAEPGHLRLNLHWKAAITPPWTCRRAAAASIAGRPVRHPNNLSKSVPVYCWIAASLRS